MRLQVECYAGHRGEQTPRRIGMGERSIAIVEVVDCWLAPDHRYFKVIGEDDVMYIVRHDEAQGSWELAVYDSGWRRHQVGRPPRSRRRGPKPPLD